MFPISSLIKDIIQWDVKNWSKAILYWERIINWEEVNNCLELGSREGGLSLWLALKGKTIICSDLNNTETSAEKLHKKYDLNKTIIYQDIDATNIPYDNFFDIIVFKSIIGGIGRNDNKDLQEKVFLQIYKALRPGGKLIFAENLLASPMHQYFRKKFIKWSVYWRYVTKDEMYEFLAPYSSFELKTTGFLGTFGRSERLREILSIIDNLLLNKIVPERWKYIIYGVAQK
jgi:SAM-dependent methyltransferase